MFCDIKILILQFNKKLGKLAYQKQYLTENWWNWGLYFPFSFRTLKCKHSKGKLAIWLMSQFVYILKQIKVLNILEFIDLKILSAANTKSSREKSADEAKTYFKIRIILTTMTITIKTNYVSNNLSSFAELEAQWCVTHSLSPSVFCFLFKESIYLGNQSINWNQSFHRSWQLKIVHRWKHQNICNHPKCL